MTTVTVNIPDDKDLQALEDVLARFGLSYTVDEEPDYLFSEAEIDMLLKRKQDFIDGKTTARDWKDIEDDLNRAYS